MDGIKRLIAAIMALFGLLLPGAGTAPKDLGIPTEDSYSEKQRLSRSVWDMAVRDGTLYIGTGDYSANTGPTPIWAYDTEAETWSVSATVEDEAVSRFCTVGETLVAPGIDDTGDSWKFGNYHTFADGEWDSFRKLPGAVHNFDVTRYGEQFFFAVGTADGKASPVLTSTDGQTEFQPVPFYKGEKSLLAGRYRFTRVYDFFTVGDSLYCLLFCYNSKGVAARMFCRYEDGAFRHISDAEFDIAPWKQLPVMGKVSFGSAQYFTTGTLYKTEDFATVTPIEMPDSGVVTDLYVYQMEQRQLLYALSNVHNEDDTYTATVYLMDEAVTAVASYTSTVPALSFVRSGMYFYLGLGGGEDAPDTGRVIRLSVFDRLLNP